MMLNGQKASKQMEKENNFECVTWKAKTTTNALPFNGTNRLYPFSTV